jgi:hypothetical protein
MCQSRRLSVSSASGMRFSLGFLFLTSSFLFIIHIVFLETGMRVARATCSVSSLSPMCFCSNSEQMIVTIDRSVGIRSERDLDGLSIVTAYGIVEHSNSLTGVSGLRKPLSLCDHLYLRQPPIREYTRETSQSDQERERSSHTSVTSSQSSPVSTDGTQGGRLTLLLVILTCNTRSRHRKGYISRWS